MVDVISEGAHGEAAVTHIEVSEADSKFDILRAAINSRRAGAVGVKAGRYAQLRVGGSMVMSDTDMEKESCREALDLARGDVLIGGLGLGMITLPILSKATVRSVTVIEESADVIALIEPQLRAFSADAAKLTVRRGDVFRWIPGATKRFDFIYMDVWSDICTDNLREIMKLHAKYRRYLRRGGKVRSWMHDELRGR